MADEIAAGMTARLAAMIADVGELVRCESPSADLAACAAGADLVAAMGRRYLGAAAERIVVDGRTHLRWRLGRPDGPRRVLLLAHLDTVWPKGSLRDHPWQVLATAGGPVLRGPGCFDMKAGLVQLFHALAVLPDPADVTVLVTADEEIGSPSSRALIEDEAHGCVAALVLEASADGGSLKSGRKGASLYEIDIRGRAAHAGLEPERGVNAGIELAKQVLRVAALGNEDDGTTVTPTAQWAGTTGNTVPAAGRLSVDVRARTRAAQESIDRAIRATVPSVPGAQVSVHGGINRPPLEASSSAALVELAQRLHANLGFGALTDTAVGGASDGNFTAGVGTPTLDGLGAVGGGAHADDEHVLAAFLPQRAALLAALVRELTR